MAACTDKIHVDDIGTLFIVTIYDYDEATDTDVAIDISSATTKEIHFMDPGGNVTAKTASFTTDGTDGKIQYATILDDLDEEGWWKIQAFIIMPSGEWHTNIDKFRVYPNLQ